MKAFWLCSIGQKVSRIDVVPTIQPTIPKRSWLNLLSGLSWDRWAEWADSLIVAPHHPSPQPSISLVSVLYPERCELKVSFSLSPLYSLRSVVHFVPHDQTMCARCLRAQFSLVPKCLPIYIYIYKTKHQTSFMMLVLFIGGKPIPYFLFLFLYFKLQVS